MPYTPGPWKVEGATLIWAPGASANIAQAGELRAGDTVGFTTPKISSPDFHEVAANAKLIAAAPDLLKALEEIYDASRDPHTERVALAAIEKAT